MRWFSLSLVLCCTWQNMPLRSPAWMLFSTSAWDWTTPTLPPGGGEWEKRGWEADNSVGHRELGEGWNGTRVDWTWWLYCYFSRWQWVVIVTISSSFGAQENKTCHCFHCFPFYLQWSMVLDAMMSIFWMLSFKPAFPLSSFTLIKRLLSSSSLSAIKVVSSAYLRSLIFLLAILVPACDSSSPAFHIMYSS